VRRSLGILASALFAVALEVVVNLIAASVAVPRRYYFVPVVAFVVLVGLQFFVAFREQQASGGNGERPASRLAVGDRHVIKGSWRKPSEVIEAVIVVLSIGSLYSGFVSLVAKPGPNREVAMTATCICAFLLAVLCWWVALGSRVCLEFSADGVAVWRGIGRKRRLRWNEARNFRAEKGYFVADPLSGSTWYVHGFDVVHDYDDENERNRICELYRAGFHSAEVNAAVRYWKHRPSPRSR
jgi:hypothetical protein